MENKKGNTNNGKTHVPKRNRNGSNKKSNIKKPVQKKKPSNIKIETKAPPQSKVKVPKEVNLREFAYSNDLALDMSVHRIVEQITLNPENIFIALYTYASRALYLNKIVSAVDNSASAYDDFSQGLAWIWEGIYNYSQGTTYSLVDVPKIFGVLAKLLNSRTVKVGRSGYVNYTPAWEGDKQDFPRYYTTPTGAVYSLASPSDQPTTMVNVPAIAGTENGYSYLTRVTDDNRYFGSTIEKFENIHGMFEKDPSAFARNYGYFGSGGTITTALYSEAEIEVPFYYPQFSKFVKYETSDMVISRVFHPQSGGLCTPIGLSLTQGDYSYSDLKNPVPVIYKFLDFNQFYSMVGFWLSNLMSVSPGAIQGTNFTNESHALPFSATDFQIILRQAILSNFPEQCHGQFIAPLQSNTLGDSVFQPFIVDNITYPKANASNLLLPNFLVENLSMLQSIHIKPTTTKGSVNHNTVPKKVSYNCIPVWGVYSQDTPPNFNYLDATGVEVPLFSSTSQIPLCQLWDCMAAGNVSQKVNINNYVDNLISIFNQNIEVYAANKSAKLAPLSVDRNKNVSLLHYTRVLEKFPVDMKKLETSNLEYPADKMISNTPKKALERKSSKKKIDAIQPATYYELYTYFITSVSPMGTDLSGALRYMLIPSIRLNALSGDKLTANAYQIYTGELDASYSTNGLNAYSVAEIYRLYQLGAQLVTGPFSATDTTNVMTLAMDTITKAGQGSDLISSLLGGLASMIPVVGPMISGLINS